MANFLDAYPVIAKVGPYLLGGAGGALGGQFLSVLKNRRATLVYHVTHARIGMTADDQTFGSVEVRYNGAVAHNLFLSVVEAKNNSIRDLENIAVKICRGHENMELLTEQSQIVSTTEVVPLTKQYFERVKSDAEWAQAIATAGASEEPENAKRLSADAKFRQGERHYVIPVLNRGQVAKFTYLTQAGPNMNPVISLASQTKGVRVKYGPQPEGVTNVFGVSFKQAGLTGVLTALLVAAIVIWRVSGDAAAWICFVVALFASVMGAGIVRACRWMREILVG